MIKKVILILSCLFMLAGLKAQTATSFTTLSKTYKISHSEELALIMPIGEEGKVATNTILFSWLSPEDIQTFVFQLYKEDGDQLIYEEELTGTETQVNLADLRVLTGQQYYWMVVDKNNPDRKSETASFTLLGENAARSILTSLERTEAYQGAGDDLERDLMKAKVLGDASFYYQAHKRFHELMNANPDNDRVVSAFLAFARKYNFD